MAKYLAQYFKNINRYKTFEIQNENEFESSISLLKKYYLSNRYFFTVILNYVYLHDAVANYGVSEWLDDFLKMNIFPESNKILFDTPEILISWEVEVERAFVNLLLSSRTYIESVSSKPYFNSKHSTYSDYFSKNLFKYDFAFFIFKVLRNNYSHNKIPYLIIRPTYGNVNVNNIPQSEMGILISKSEFIKDSSGDIKNSRLNFSTLEDEINLSCIIDRHMDIILRTNEEITENLEPKISWESLRKSTKMLCTKEIDLRCSYISIIETKKHTFDVLENIRTRDCENICSISTDILKICEFLFINFDSKRLYTNPFI